MKKNSFSKKEHLKKNEAIKDVFDKATPFKGRFIRVYVVKNDTSPINRAAFIIRKTLCDKKAVLRNRFKRLLREAYRKTKHLLPQGYDIVILATSIKKNTSPGDSEREIAHAFKKTVNR